MAHFYQNDTTTAGEALIAEAIAEGGVFTPTRIVIGSGDLPSGTQPSDMTALVSQKASCEINKKVKTEGGTAAIVGAAFTNENVTEGFYFKEIGVYAKVVYSDDTESEEVLYSYGNAGEQGDYIAAYSQDTLVEFQIDVTIYVGDEVEINLELKSNIYVPVEEFEELENDTYRKNEVYTKEEILNVIYPVGSIYISVNSTNPAEIIGGTWTLWGSGRTPVCVDTTQTEFNTAEKTGGEKEHSLNVNEMPSHNHEYSDSITPNNVSGTSAASSTGNTYILTETYMHDRERTSEGTGGNQPHNNLQPYITCYMWKRTA